VARRIAKHPKEWNDWLSGIGKERPVTAMACSAQAPTFGTDSRETPAPSAPPQNRRHSLAKLLNNCPRQAPGRFEGQAATVTPQSVRHFSRAKQRSRRGLAR